METRLLEYFLTVAREKNITKSAKLLHITQPTLSRQLTQLEEILGQQLLIRHKKGLSLTEAGLMLERRAEEIIQLVAKTERELQNEDEQMVGRLSIGSGESTVSFEFLPNVIKDFHRSYPSVTYEFYTGDALLIKEKINHGLLDVGILLEPVDITSFEALRLPFQEPWGVVVSDNHPLANNDVIVPSDLKDIPIFYPKKIHEEIKSWAKDDFQYFQSLGNHNLISNIIAIVEKDIGGVLTIQGCLARQKNTHLKFIPLSPPLTSGHVLVWKKHSIQNAITKMFITKIKDSIQQLEKEEL